MRQLLILSLLRPFLESEGVFYLGDSRQSLCYAEHERYAIRVIAFYATGLPEDIIPAELDFFATFYLDTSGEVALGTATLTASADE